MVIVILFFDYVLIHSREMKLDPNFNALQTQTVITYNLLIKKEKEVQNLELEINKIRQKQAIYKSKRARFKSLVKSPCLCTSSQKQCQRT